MDPLTERDVTDGAGTDDRGVDNIAARLQARARSQPEHPAIIQGRGRLRRVVTFAELAQRAAGVGEELRRRGIEPGQRVLLFVPMSIDLYVALLGVLHAGATAVFVDAWAGRRRLRDAVAAAHPAAFIGTPRAQLLRITTPAVRRIPVRLWAGPGPFRLGRGAGAAEAGTATPVDVPGAAPALVTFTTGTTGRPKAAVRSHAFLEAQHRVLAGHLGLRPDDVDMPTLPVFVLNNLALGVTSVIPDFDPRRPAEIDPDSILAQMAGEGVTTTSGSPAFYERLHGRIPVRALFTGGAPVFPPLARQLASQVDGEAHVLYGSTEAEPIAGITAGDLVRAAAEPGAMGVCAGEPVPEIAWRIIRPVDGELPAGAELAGLEVADGESGELLVAGDHVLKGYLDDPESEALTKVREGATIWHRTGDGARYDGHRLWLMGRLSQRVARGGDTWWSMAAEVRALSVPGVAHAAYLGVRGAGVADAAEAEAVLCVELKDGGPVDAALAARLREALAPIPVDRAVALAIPRDPRHASKTDVGRLRERIMPQ